VLKPAALGIRDGSNRQDHPLGSGVAQQSRTARGRGPAGLHVVDQADGPTGEIDGAAQVSTGDVSGVIDAGDGSVWVPKQTGRRKAMTRTLADASQQIRNKLYREKRVDAQKQFIDGLRNKARISIDEASLSKVKIDTSTQGGDPHGDSAPLPDFTKPPAESPGTTQMPVPPPVDPPATK
jgi:hypothetical protein